MEVWISGMDLIKSSNSVRNRMNTKDSRNGAIVMAAMIGNPSDFPLKNKKKEKNKTNKINSHGASVN